MSSSLTEYFLDYSELIITSEKNKTEKLNDFENLYNEIYHNARSQIYDRVYEGVLNELYNSYYDGILKNSYSSIEYDEWLVIIYNEYSLWSETNSEVYDIWYHLGLDISNLYNDIIDDLNSNNIEDALETLDTYQKAS